MKVASVHIHEDIRRKKKSQEKTHLMLFVVIRQNRNVRVRKVLSWDLGQDEFKTGQVIGFLLE